APGRAFSRLSCFCLRWWYPGRCFGWRLESLVEPFDPAPQDVATVLRPAHEVALARGNDPLRRHLHRLQGVVKLLRLRQGAGQVALADQHESGCLDALDEGDRRAACVDGRVVVDRGTEIRDQPLVDPILAVIALPVGDPGAGDRGPEAIGLRHRPHGHVAAVTPPTDTEAVFVHRLDAKDLVQAGQDGAPIALAAVLDVRPG